MENGYRPAADSSIASITARPSTSSTSCTTNRATPASPICTVSPTEITPRSIIEQVIEEWQPQYEVRGRVVTDPLRLYPVPGGMAEPAPITCRHGHRLGPQKMTVGWVSCPVDGVRGGHRTHTCLRCVAMEMEEPTIYTPRRDEDCPCRDRKRTKAPPEGGADG